MIRRPPRSTPLYSSAASDVYKRQQLELPTSESEAWIARLLRHSYAQVWRKLPKIQQRLLPLGIEIYNQAQNEQDLL